MSSKLAIVIFGTMIVMAAEMGLADIYSLRPSGPMDERPAANVAKLDLDNASRSIDTALNLDRFNPGYWEDKARIDCNEASRRNNEVLLDDALLEVRRSIRLRPVSPYSWGTLMQIKIALGEIDGEFSRALENAAKLGPWEMETQRAIAEAGLDAWSTLPPSGRMIVLENIRRGMRRQSSAMIQIALGHGNRVQCD